MLGFTVPEGLIARISEQDRVMPVQTHRFAWALVDALRENGVHVDLVSSAPVSSFPGHRRVIWPLRHFEERGVDGLALPFVNVTILKHVTRLLACLTFGFARLRRQAPDVLLVHGVHSPYLWFALVVRRGLRTPCVAVLTDPPGVVRAEDSWLARKLKRLDVKVTKVALSRFDGVVALTEPLAQDFAPGVPSLLMEGMTTMTPSTLPARQEPTNRRTVVYAGGLFAQYGVQSLVEAVKLLDDVRLELYGKGDLEEWIAEQATADPRIAVPRFVSPADLPKVYAHATVLVQPRPVDQGFVPYSFPSKLLEYLATGVPVVSTRLPSIPVEYEHVLTWSGDSPQELAQALRSVLALSADERRRRGEAGASFARNSRSPRVQGARLEAFLQTLRHERGHALRTRR